MTTDAQAAHLAAIATLTSATTTAELAAAIAGFARTAGPGFANGLPDGQYFDGLFFATMTDGQFGATKAFSLPPHTLALWEQMLTEQRIDAERDRLVAEDEAERRGPGQPAIGRPVPVRLPAWLIDALDRDAEAAGVTRARLIRDLITEARAARRAA